VQISISISFPFAVSSKIGLTTSRNLIAPYLALSSSLYIAVLGMEATILTSLTEE
jgi:hypothetical protein